MLSLTFDGWNMRGIDTALQHVGALCVHHAEHHIVTADLAVLQHGSWSVGSVSFQGEILATFNIRRYLLAVFLGFSVSQTKCLVFCNSRASTAA